MRRPIVMSLLASCLLVALASCTEQSTAPQERDNQVNSAANFDISSYDISNVDNNDNNNDLLFNYNPVEPNRLSAYKTQSRKPAEKLNSRAHLEEGRGESPPVGAVMPAGSSAGSANSERAKDIALNSREVRLMYGKEVEMKDNVADKIVVALDNLQKEAATVWGQVNEKLDKGWSELKRSEVWGQVNEKLDKGWTDLKSMVEGVVSPPSKRESERKQN